LATKDDIIDAPLFKGAAKMEVVKIVVNFLKESICSETVADLMIENYLVLDFANGLQSSSYVVSLK
jgi:hypothetical protein